MAQGSLGRGDNLTISIGVDTKKLRADAALVKVELENINKAVKEAARAGDLPGLTAATAKQDTLIRQYGTLTRVIRENTAETNRNVTAQKHIASAHAETGRSLAQVLFGTRAHAVSLEQLSESATHAIFGVRALRLGFAGLALELSRHLFTGAAEDINKLRESAESIRAPTDTIQAFGKGIEQAGGNAEDAVPILQRLAEVANQARQKVLEAGGTLGGTALAKGGAGTGGIVDFGTRTADVLEGATTKAVDFADNLKKGLGIDISLPRFRNFDNLLTDIARGLVRLNDAGKVDEANLRSTALLTKNFTQLEEVLRKAAGGGGIADLKQALGDELITPEQIERAKEFKIALNELLGTLQALRRTITTDFAPGITGALQSLTEVLKSPAFKEDVSQFLHDVLTLVRNTREEIEKIKALIGVGVQVGAEVGKQAGQGIAAPGGAEVPILSDAATNAEDAATKTESAWTDSINSISRDIDALGALFSALWANVTSQSQTAAQTVSSAITDIAASSDADISGGFASGGFVRGPGTGRSDSILARLSNGEFVLNAKAVQRLGVGFLHGLNGFAQGGLIGAPPLKFAAGGLVSDASSSGRAVHLHLGGQSFPLSGSTAVVDALVSHAHSQQIRSTGVKPSWFAARPSGR